MGRHDQTTDMAVDLDLFGIAFAIEALTHAPGVVFVITGIVCGAAYGMARVFTDPGGGRQLSSPLSVRTLVLTALSAGSRRITRG